MENRAEECQETAGHAQVRKHGIILNILSHKSTFMVGRYQPETTRMKTDDLCVRRFTLNSEVDLKTALLNMGLGDMFNLATADFTRITSKFTSCTGRPVSSGGRSIQMFYLSKSRNTTV